MPLPHQNLVGESGSSPRLPPFSEDVTNGSKKEPLDFTANNGNTGDTTETDAETDAEDRISKQLYELQEELFESLKEDISDWIMKTLSDTDINADNFIHVLDTGVILCRLSQAIENKAGEAFKEGKLTEWLPGYKLHCNVTAKSGTWFARDNTANFLTWCRGYGMTDETLFDSEDLVTHHHERQVIYCLMELARLGARFGLEPPTLISMEREIDHGGSPPATLPPPPPPITIEIISKADPPLLAPSPRPPTPPIIPATSTPPSKSGFVPPSKSGFVPSSRSSTVSTLDSEVNRVARNCKCQDYVDKLGEGVYNVVGKRVFIRLLKGKHLMVRVGGGWDTFENYLLHHDPMQVFEFRHHNPAQGAAYNPAQGAAYNSAQGAAYSCTEAGPSFQPHASNSYLVIRSKYRSKNFD